MGMVVNDLNGDPLSHNNVLKRVNLYITRFPEIEYLIDMISSSVIYSSSSNTKKIQFILNGEYRVAKPQPTTPVVSDSTSDLTSANQPAVKVSDINLDSEMEKVDSWYQDLNLDVGNLFRKNNIKLSLYGLMTSMTKYGCGLFYVYDPGKWTDVALYGLDEVEFRLKNKDFTHNAILNQLHAEQDSLFKSNTDNDEIQQLNTSQIDISLVEDGTKLLPANIYFISERGVYGKSLVVKIIHYLKIIELLELSLLIERLSKTRTTHVWKLDLAKVEEEDIAPTMLLYRNLLKNQMAMNYDENSNDMQFDIVKNLVDNNILVPTEADNLKIDTLKSEFKPLLEDVNYYWDKIYQAMGIPLHYRKGTDSKAYVNNNMLIMHDNVYAMKIRHYQLIINNLLTFWIENWLKYNHSQLEIKYININIPEFIPISERKETDLDKAAKFVTVFTQLEQMLGMKIKDEFILNTLFPNDLLTDIIDIDNIDVEEAEAADVAEGAEETTEEEDIMSLFESGILPARPKRDQKRIQLFTAGINRGSSKINYKLRLNIDW